MGSGESPQRSHRDGGTSGARRRSRARSELAADLAPVGVLGGLVLIVSAFSPSFLSVYSLQVLAAESSVILLLAIGQTIVILLGGIDLSVASTASLTSVLVALLLPGFGAGAVVFALGIAGLIGALQGFVHARAKIPSFIVTLAGLGLWSGIALAIAHTTIPVTGRLEVVSWLNGLSAGVPNAFMVALGTLALFQAALPRSRFGRYLHAIGLAERAALLSGVPVWRVKTIAFAASGLCAGLAGVDMVARTGSGNPTIADSLLLPAIAAVLLGGTALTGGHGNLVRTLVGACITSVMRVGIALAGIAPAWEAIAYGAVVIIAVAMTVDRRPTSAVK